MTSQRLLIKYNWAIYKDPFPYIPITSIAMMLPWGIDHSFWWFQHWKNPLFCEFPRVQAGDLVSRNQISSPQTLSRKLEWQILNPIHSREGVDALLVFTLLSVPPPLADTWPIASGHGLLLHIALLEKHLLNTLGQEVSWPAGGISCLTSLWHWDVGSERWGEYTLIHSRVRSGSGSSHIQCPYSASDIS